MNKEGKYTESDSEKIIKMGPHSISVNRPWNSLIISNDNDIEQMSKALNTAGRLSRELSEIETSKLKKRIELNHQDSGQWLQECLKQYPSDNDNSNQDE